MDNYVRVKGKIEVVRHGEVELWPVKELPTGLTKAKTDVLMKGSGGNSHIAKNCDIYFKAEDNYILGYVRANKGAKLLHKEHGNSKLKKINGLKMALVEQRIYQLRRRNEVTPNGLKRPVED